MSDAPSRTNPPSPLALPLPPPVKDLWRVEGGRVVRSAIYRDWLDAVREAVRSSTQKAVFGPYVLSVTCHRAAEVGGDGFDLDALLKPLTAALSAAGLIGDDSLAERIVVRWSRVTGEDGRLEIQALPASPETARHQTPTDTSL